MFVAARRLCAALGLAVLVLFVPAAAAWAQAVDPSPAPSPTPSTVAPATYSTVALVDEQFWVLGFGLLLLVFLASAHVVGSWRK